MAGRSSQCWEYVMELFLSNRRGNERHASDQNCLPCIQAPTSRFACSSDMLARVLTIEQSCPSVLMVEQSKLVRKGHFCCASFIWPCLRATTSALSPPWNPNMMISGEPGSPKFNHIGMIEGSRFC